MQIFNLLCQGVNLFSKIAVQNVETKLIYGYRFVAPLRDIVLKEQMYFVNERKY